MVFQHLVFASCDRVNACHALRIGCSCFNRCVKCDSRVKSRAVNPICNLAAVSVIRRRDDAEAFGRRIPESAVRNAGAILFIYLFLFTSSAAAISLIEGLPLSDCLFETGSAVGTVGLTLGLTPSLSTVSHVILMALMFLGRVGVLTLIYAALPSGTDTDSRLPMEKISIG